MLQFTSKPELVRLGHDDCGPADNYNSALKFKTTASRTHAMQWFFSLFLLGIRAKKGATRKLRNLV